MEIINIEETYPPARLVKFKKEAGIAMKSKEASSYCKAEKFQTVFNFEIFEVTSKSSKIKLKWKFKFIDACVNDAEQSGALYYTG